MIRFVSFIACAVIVFIFPEWVFVVGALAYSFAYNTPYELLVLTVCVDALFGDPNVGVWYVYTLTVSVLLVGASFIKPYLRAYT